MSIKCSIVTPAYNRINQLLLTLVAFEKQTFPRDNFEVIVVDDGSTDRTKELFKNYKASFIFNFPSFTEKRGPAFARNTGIEQAKGDYIIFCDADFLVLPQFIETHYNYHFKYKDVIVTGTPYCFKAAYTQYFPEFSNREKKLIRLTLQKSRLWKNSYLQSTNAVEIITEEDLKTDFTRIKRVLGPNVISHKLKNEFLKTDVAPWLLFITRCLSAKKSDLVKAGGFDERLIRGEDWELGYRLYKSGLTFTSIKKTIGYHQEHPNSFRKQGEKFVPFYKFLYEQYGFDDPELLLLSIWDSSDELWREIPTYKNTLRLLREKDYSSKKYRDMAKTLIKAASKMSKGRFF